MVLHYSVTSGIVTEHSILNALYASLILRIGSVVISSLSYLTACYLCRLFFAYDPVMVIHSGQRKLDSVWKSRAIDQYFALNPFRVVNTCCFVYFKETKILFKEAAICIFTFDSDCRINKKYILEINIQKEERHLNFQDLMNCYNISDGESNQIVYNNLLELFKKQNITPVIGAGLSHWAYPLWSEMLKDKGKDYRIGERVQQLIDDGEFELAASALEDAITPNQFKLSLQHIFRVSLMNECSTRCPAYLKRLPHLFNGPILTTNFDRAIEYLFKEEGLPCPDMVIPSDNFQSDKISFALHRNASILVKMHGDIADPQHLILTQSSYNDVYGDNQKHPDLEKPMPTVLQKVLNRNPLLFLGCSLTADRTCSVIQTCSPNNQQFAILELPDATENPDNPFQPILWGENNQFKEDWKERRKYILQELNIQAIWYPHGMHDEALNAFFTKLSEDLGVNFGTNTFSTPFRLISKLPQPRQYCFGRDNQIEEIHKNFTNGNHVIFLEGIGGIGKSELAKQYATKYRHEYKNILFATFTTSLKDLICDSSAILIENLVQAPGENEYAFYQRKLQQLQILANNKTLLIIDNFDVDNDPELEKFLEGSYDIIFTTRNVHFEYPSVYVSEIRNFDIMLKIFTKYYGKSVREDDIPYLKDIFEFVQYHTYAVELIAKQMAASSLTANKMLVRLKGKELIDITETVTGRSDQKTAFQHLTSLFDIGKLNESEQKIMMYLSLMGTAGVQSELLKEWAELSSYETVIQLARRSWVREEIDGKYSLHPLVREVVWNRLKPCVENCRVFLTQIAKFCYGAWRREYQKNLEATNNILAVLEYFKALDAHEFGIFIHCSYFLWQVGKFDDAIYYCRKLYNSCLEEFGEDSIETGYAARCVGGCYFNSGNLKDSILWYKLALDCMKLATDEDCMELAISYEKVGRCYTWKVNPDQNFDKAKQNFQIALDMHIRLRDAIKAGEKLSSIENPWNFDLGVAEGNIAGTYLELGRMYQEMDDYEQALECAIRHGEITAAYQQENVSGLAYSYYDQGLCHYHLGLQAKAHGETVTAMDELQQAVQKLEEALSSNMKMRGALAIDTIVNQELLADAYIAMAQGFYDKASSGYAVAKNMAENLLGKNCKQVQMIQEKWKGGC